MCGHAFRKGNTAPCQSPRNGGPQIQLDAQRLRMHNSHSGPSAAPKAPRPPSLLGATALPFLLRLTVKHVLRPALSLPYVPPISFSSVSLSFYTSRLLPCLLATPLPCFPYLFFLFCVCVSSLSSVVIKILILEKSLPSYSDIVELLSGGGPKSVPAKATFIVKPLYAGLNSFLIQLDGFF